MSVLSNKHSREEYILRTFEIHQADGSIQHIARSKSELLDTAIPCILLNVRGLSEGGNYQDLYGLMKSDIETILLEINDIQRVLEVPSNNACQYIAKASNQIEPSIELLEKLLTETQI